MGWNRPTGIVLCNQTVGVGRTLQEQFKGAHSVLRGDFVTDGGGMIERVDGRAEKVAVIRADGTDLQENTSG